MVGDRVHRGARFKLPVVVAAAALLAGCVASSFYTSETLKRGTSDLRVLLMPLDVQLSEISAGGVTEPKADWTALAEKHLTVAVTKYLKGRKARLVGYKVPERGSAREKTALGLVKLHSAVGTSILLHQYVPLMKLPSKGEKFDWSLGPGVAHLRDEFDADYAMFIHIRDSYASAGRTAVIVIAALAFGVAMPGGVQVGFASLVDLRTGEVVWFNRLARGEGDLRTLEVAEETVKTLLTDLPK